MGPGFRRDCDNFGSTLSNSAPGGISHALACRYRPVLSLLPGSPRAATLIEARTGFSAERTLVIDGHTYQGKVWAMPGKERHEQEISGMQPVFLLRGDSGLGEIVLQSLKTVVQFEIPAELRLLDVAALKTPRSATRRSTASRRRNTRSTNRFPKAMPRARCG